MVTNLTLEQQVVLGGESIAVFKWTLANTHLQQPAEVLSRLQLALLECDSNNTTGVVIGTDSESIQAEWSRFKYEWNLGKQFRNLAPAAQEKVLSVLAITDNEQLRTVNVKCRRVVVAVSTLIQKIVFCDSAKLQYGIGDSDIKKIEAHIAYVEKVLGDYMGDGTEKDGSYNTGMAVPAFEFLGNVVPPINLHEAQVQEPSPAAPDVPMADAPDTPSTVPVPGSNTQAR
jgi:hypothetical protein